MNKTKCLNNKNNKDANKNIKYNINNKHNININNRCDKNRYENDNYIIHGGKRLNGRVKVQTSKNATLPILAASIMCDGEVQINNYPHITDLENMLNILRGIGVQINQTETTLTLNSQSANNLHMNFDLMKTMRSSIFLLGSLLARFKTATITQPGGCKIGARPIDIHLKSLKQMGVKICEVGDLIFFDASQSHSANIKLSFASVGATENIVQFACLTKGKTVITNAAQEPEIVDLCCFLNKMGARISGVGTSKITIQGVDCLKSTQYTPISDRVVAGTYMVAVAICGGKVTLTNVEPSQNTKLIEKLKQIGCQIKTENDIITISSEGVQTTFETLSTGTYPNFATDLQSQMLVLACFAKGSTQIFETVFENRFLIVPELQKMGAIINIINNKQVSIYGKGKLHCAKLQAQDLRGGAALVLAALGAKGVSSVDNIHFILRGYENFEQTLSSLGADIKRK